MGSHRPGRWQDHPRFGRMPLIPHPDGGLEHDPDHEPPMPPGAVRGDIRRQSYCRMCHVPRYFYVDAPRTCVQCQEPFVFSAAEQKYWYETLQFWADSTAIRCLDCRRKQRSKVAIQRQLCAALAGLAKSPDDPGHLLEVAEARVKYREAFGSGDLDGGLAAARRAFQLWPGEPRALFWEGRLQELAGRPAKARECYRRFVAEARDQRGSTALRRHAERFLASG